MDFQFLTFEPPADLRPVLRRSFFARGRIAYRTDKILPNGLVPLLFTLGAPHRLGKAKAPEDNPTYGRSWLHGVQTTPIYNTPAAETHVLGLLFEPLGFHALFGTDMRTLADRTASADRILPAGFLDRVEASLPRADKAEGHVDLHAILRTLPIWERPPWLRALYESIADSRGRLSLASAYRTAGRSPRHVNATFRRAVGVSPKTLCRIFRLSALLEAVDPAGPVDWAGLAADSGYYDQAHFNRDFKQFSGLTPRRYMAQRRRDLPTLGRGESVHFAPQR